MNEQEFPKKEQFFRPLLTVMQSLDKTNIYDLDTIRRGVKKMMYGEGLLSEAQLNYREPAKENRVMVDVLIQRALNALRSDGLVFNPQPDMRHASRHWQLTDEGRKANPLSFEIPTVVAGLLKREQLFDSGEEEPIEADEARARPRDRAGMIRERRGWRQARQAVNEVLYGPPGTGKTYEVVRRAVELATGEDRSKTEREVLQREFDGLMDAGHVRLVTFHPSYG
jgi:hypothetical protein